MRKYQNDFMVVKMEFSTQYKTRSVIKNIAIIYPAKFVFETLDTEQKANRYILSSQHGKLCVIENS